MCKVRLLGNLEEVLEQDGSFLEIRSRAKEWRRQRVGALQISTV